MPLTVQGQAYGLLHWRASRPLGAAPGAEMPGHWFSEVKQQLAQTVSDNLTLALTSLQLRETLRQQSIRDPVTGLFNRRYMEETLEREIWRAARSQGPVSIIMLDIDHFKQFNDTFGHEAGDVVLREIGACLRAQIRAEDIACRYGGEEFTLIMPAASIEVARHRAEHILDQVKRLAVHHHGHALGQITASLGVAMYPEHGETGEAVLAAADAALYRAKHAGRDRVLGALAGEGAAPHR
jgi:diguanylate cyclase (GGDEF)-like protein